MEYLMILSVLMICILGYGMKVTIPVAVVIVKLLGKIKFHTELVPEFANTFSEFRVSVRRIVQFLNSPEIESHLIEVKNSRDHFEDAIEIKKSNFFWGFDHSDSDGSESEDELDQSNEDTLSKSTSQLIEGENNKNSSDTDREEYNLQTVYSKITLKDIELKIPKGELVAIIGDVGSGKSSLINTLLGETLHIDYNTLDKYGDKKIDSHLEESINIIKKSNNASLKFIDKVMQERNRIAIETSPKIYITGSISLVQQKPFILSQTIRDNILFGEELNNDRYNRVVEASQLGRDLEILEGGDLTQIGEKGVNLSGGQKARLSIARAVYSNRDIILMDDPLSALDAHVKKAIFDEVCCKELRDRTRIIVTHAVDFLDRVDRIIVFENGKIKLNGTFEDIKEEDYFKEIIKTKTNHEREDEEEHSNASEDTSEIEEAKKNHLSGKEKKLLEDIDDKEVNVSSSTYLSYFMYLKQGLIFIAIGVIIRVLVRVGHMQSEYLILKWVKDFSSTEIPEYESLKYISLVVVSTIAIDLFSWVVEVIQNYMIDKKMFQEMFDRVLNAPINLFFDKMPSTLITKRFTSDLNCSSRELPHTIKWNLRNLICM